MSQAKPDAIVNYTNTLSYYEENIFPLEVLDVIFLEDSAKQYETFISRLKKYVLESSMVDVFEVYPNLPGSPQYTAYGAGTFTVIKKIVPTGI